MFCRASSNRVALTDGSVVSAHILTWQISKDKGCFKNQQRNDDMVFCSPEYETMTFMVFSS